MILIPLFFAAFAAAMAALIALPSGNVGLPSVMITIKSPSPSIESALEIATSQFVYSISWICPMLSIAFFMSKESLVGESELTTCESKSIIPMLA